ncbi:phosphatase PAP2 family protein [Actinoallomurus sp. CA-142502]|uniref:phosphatase PAP2 family protein n=1 Tax=Actinoallomurus sp. CA-142502 TaxID=3239885 RepID=UPI003D90ED7D
MFSGFDDGAYREMVTLARHTPWLNAAVNLWSDYGLVLFIVLAAAGLRRGGGVWRALWVPGAMAVAYLVSAVVKLGIGEQRPCRTLPAVGHIVSACPPLGDYSFPSNHAVLAAAAAVAVWRIDRRLGVVAAVNAVVIAASRVYIGVHYPHDVVAGLLLGALVAWAGEQVGLPIVKRFAGPARLRPRGSGTRDSASSCAGRDDDRIGEEPGYRVEEDASSRNRPTAESAP